MNIRRKTILAKLILLQSKPIILKNVLNFYYLNLQRQIHVFYKCAIPRNRPI